MELLEKLMIRCQDCNEIVSYVLYDTHQLKHMHCEFCSEPLTSWNEIREHYYQKCLKYVVDCDKCEFSFNRQEYRLHDCLEHYNLRQIELILFLSTCLA